MKDISALPSMELFDWSSASSSPLPSPTAEVNGLEEEEEEEDQNLPYGFAFAPTEEELVLYYLGNKVLGRRLPSNAIKEIDHIYQFDPEEILVDKFKNGREYEAYYFTYTERNQDGTLPESITKSGYWKINCSEEEEIYNDDGSIIVGFRRRFLFHWGKVPNGTRSTWFIYEYRLNPSIVPLDVLNNNENVRTNVEKLVACRVMKRNLDRVVHKLKRKR